MLHVVPLRLAARVLVACAAAVLVACGGGGGGGGSAGAVAAGSQLFPSAASLANVCTAEGQKQWVRSYLDENYLWADEIQDVPSSDHADARSYFDALLVRTRDGSGLARDRFSTSMTAAGADAMQGTIASGSALAAASSPVPLVTTHTTLAGKAGYILFNQHTKGAQDALIAAFRDLRTANVNDLVLDLRYNPGGFLYIAQAAASMVAGASAEGRLFEGVRYNSRRSWLNASESFWFTTQVQTAETNYPVGSALPQLGLSRLYVLTSQLTCSASESIINGLRGIGVQVVLVGDRTCGKPYGFHRKDNCGQAYFPIEFQMVNAAGFGDYTAGFPVQCRVQENYSTFLGAANEPLLAAALNHINTGSCPAGTSTGIAAAMLLQGMPSAAALPPQRADAPPRDSPIYQPGFNGRILQP